MFNTRVGVISWYLGLLGYDWNHVLNETEAMGLVVRPMYNMCVMSPPLVIERPQIDVMVDILREGVLRTQKDLEAEGVWTPADAAV